MRALESTFSKRDSRGDSVLGNHSADLANFEVTADPKSSSASKFAKNCESNTAIPRILEEESQSSLRADEIGAAIHKNAKAQNADSRFFTQAAQPAHHDSRNCGGALRVFEKFRAGVTLSGNDCPKFFKPRESLAQS